MEISTFYGNELAVTGSEISFSHKATNGKSAYSIDIGTNINGSRFRYAPFTCKVIDVNTKYNTLYCESVEKVISPRFPKGEYLCFGIGHLKALMYKKGDIIKQGEILGEDWYTGLSDKSAIHTHWSFGVGKFKGLHRVGYYQYNGKLVDGVYAISSDGYIHSYDFFCVEENCRITTKKDNPAYAYPYKRVTEYLDKDIKPTTEVDYKAFYDKYHTFIEGVGELFKEV